MPLMTLNKVKYSTADAKNVLGYMIVTYTALHHIPVKRSCKPL